MNSSYAQAEPMVQVGPEVVNDFSIVVATVNGTGSQTANTAIIRALFQMGLPVSGKNLFPSNISGLPTWYTIRVSEKGYTARRDTSEVLVAFNENTWQEDVSNLPAGGVCVYNQDIKNFAETRTDIVYYGLPVRALVKQTEVPANLRDYVATMAYVGALIHLLGLEYDEIRNAIVRHFGGKEKPIALNMKMIDLALAHAQEKMPVQHPYRVERRDMTGGLMLLDGNTAGGIGAVMGGATVLAWYPITPATSFADGMTEWFPRLRNDDEGKPTYAIVQAEDELAAIGMVIGAGWAGARAVTSTSGPGISLMAEFVGLAYYAEIPAVIWDIQRMGPSTGLPTRVSQGDVLPAYTLSHGDSKHVVLFPGSIVECFDFGKIAFDLAEQLQTPVLVLSDLDLGMNQWMSEPFTYPTEPLQRGKVLSAEDLDKLINEQGRWGRYQDVDGDGIGWRTLPGNPHPKAAYFARGTGHNEWAVYSERSDDWEHNMARLTRKHATARTLVPAPIVVEDEGATVAFISLGTNDAAIKEAQDMLRADGIATSYMRVRALPLSAEVKAFAEKYERVYVVEMNTDAQLCQILRMDYPELAAKFRPLNYCNGLPLSARWIVNAFKSKEQ